MDKLTIGEVEEIRRNLSHSHSDDEMPERLAYQLLDTMRENERLRKELSEYQQDAQKLVNLVTGNKHSGLDTNYMTITSEEDINSLVKITFMGHGGSSGHKRPEVFFDPSCLPGEVNFRLKQEQQAKTPE